MSLQRRDIREALKNALINETDCDEKVYNNRVLPVFPVEPPLIIIVARSEQIEVFGESGPREYKRTLEIQIQIIVEKSDDVDEKLDIIGQQVENRVFESFELDKDFEDLAGEIMLKSSEMSIEKNGDNEYGSLILTYDVEYYTLASIPTGDLEWLDRIDTTWEIVEGVSAPTANDSVSGLSGL